MRAVYIQNDVLVIALHEAGLRQTHAVSPHGTLVLEKDTLVEPDLMIVLRQDAQSVTRPEHVSLVIEDAVTCKPYDLGEKRRRYAVAGIPEVWVCEADKGVLHVFREPKDGAYASYQELSQGTLALVALPQLTFEIGDLLA